MFFLHVFCLDVNAWGLEEDKWMTYSSLIHVTQLVK